MLMEEVLHFLFSFHKNYVELFDMVVHFFVLTVLMCSRFRGVGSRVDCFVLGTRPFASESCRKKEIITMLQKGIRWVLGVAD